MEFEFDKEIDSLLRQAARQETFVSTKFNAHLDADEISAFAENALPQKARLNAMEHLADCSKCRKILANVISFNAETESEIIHAVEEPKTIVAVPKIPWFRQLFAFPNLAYTMGGLALVFSGILGYVVFQSLNQSQNSSIAQADRTMERPQMSKGASSEGDVPTTSYSNTTASAANTAANSSSRSSNANIYINPSATPVSPSIYSNANASGPLDEKDIAGETERRKEAAPKSAVPVTTEESSAGKSKLDENKPVEKNEKNADAVTKSGNYGNTGNDEINLAQNSAPRSSQQSQNNMIITPDTRNGQRGGMNRESRDDERIQKKQAYPAPAPKKSAEDLKDKNDDSRTVNGKTFKRIDGIWKDAAYTGGSTKIVKRSSDNYKKLDQGLRAIADNLGGTVIVVWNTKAYKIQ